MPAGTNMYDFNGTAVIFVPVKFTFTPFTACSKIPLKCADFPFTKFTEFSRSSPTFSRPFHDFSR